MNSLVQKRLQEAVEQPGMEMPADPTKSPFRDLNEINSEISLIFNRHGVKVFPGEVGFRQAVNEVATKDRDDASRLLQLSDEWTTAFEWTKFRDQQRPKI